MSQRNVRKLRGDHSLPPPDDSSDEEVNPFSKQTAPRFAGLELSSNSGSEQETPEKSAPEEECQGGAIKKKSKKKKIKKNKRRARPIFHPNENFLEMDEIDRSLMEVNALLGPPAPAKIPKEPERDIAKELFTVENKHIYASYEMDRVLGPEEKEHGAKRQGRTPNYTKIHKRFIIDQKTSSQFKKFGLSMSIHHTQNDVTYFVFDHNKEYQNLHRAYLAIPLHQMDFFEPQSSMHVEGIIENADKVYMHGEYSTANNYIEYVISYMQFVAHSAFNLTNRNTRLEYRYLENRPFHVAILKYLYVTSNKVCHRTALELAKLLMNLDPSDPLAILFVIDIMALRAREHKWLVDAIEYWIRDRTAGYLYNIQYSYAMARYHVAKNADATIEGSDTALKNAMLHFPSLVTIMLECCSYSPSERIRTHPLFTSLAGTSRVLKDLITLYCKLCWSRWKEPDVLQWLLRNVGDLLDEYDNDESIRISAELYRNERQTLFRTMPPEVARHLSIIHPMSSLLIENGEVPFFRPQRACDPFPPVDTVDRYSYLAHTGTPNQPEREPLVNFIQAMRDILDDNELNQHDLNVLAQAYLNHHQEH